jgi:hypothetical protein
MRNVSPKSLELHDASMWLSLLNRRKNIKIAPYGFAFYQFFLWFLILSIRSMLRPYSINLLMDYSVKFPFNPKQKITEKRVKKIKNKNNPSPSMTSLHGHGSLFFFLFFFLYFLGFFFFGEHNEYFTSKPLENLTKQG